MNAPNRSDAYIVPDDSIKVTFEPDTKVPNAGKFNVLREDHTLGNLLRMQLLRDPNVIFAGYKHPHPLIHDIHIRIQTNDQFNPLIAMNTALDSCIYIFDTLSTSLRSQVQQIKKNKKNAVTDDEMESEEDFNEP